ncbi:MAG TPA: GNAT family N-acetyltransferase [Mycobacteriales bacterium]|nr:GNAT family N-acetyltransferase [Mycobacteriales bacterium]
MTETVEPEVAPTARSRSAVAAPTAAVAVELVHSEADARAAVEVLALVWPRADQKEPLPPELAWVFAHSGNYVSLARSNGEVIGAAIGFRGDDEDGIHLHSHIAGVRPDWQGSNVGFALKQHQRRWALDRGLTRITWTFDPLVARNAYFNVTKLGAELTRYYVDFYGPMDDGINVGDETDRCLVTWRLDANRARQAAEGVSAPVDVTALRAAGAVEVLCLGAADAPVRTADSGSVRLVQLPRDIVAVRQSAPDLARAWRLALREVLVAAFADGLEVVGVTRDSCYVLAAPAG